MRRSCTCVPHTPPCSSGACTCRCFAECPGAAPARFHLQQRQLPVLLALLMPLVLLLALLAPAARSSGSTGAAASQRCQHARERGGHVHKLPVQHVGGGDVVIGSPDLCGRGQARGEASRVRVVLGKR